MQPASEADLPTAPNQAEEPPPPALPPPEVAEPQKPMTPVSVAERIDVIDILRGLALFGILAANMRGFNAPEATYFKIKVLFGGIADTLAQGFVDFFIQGKFVTLFSFLFGLGFAIQMTRAAERGQNVWFYARRLFFLLLIGCAHAFLVWWGDILILYAATGFVLMAFRKAKPKTVGIWAAALISAIPILMIGLWIATQFGVKPPNGGGADYKAIQQAIETYRNGSYLDFLRQNFRDWTAMSGMLPLGIFIFTLPRFLAGLWVFRAGVLTHPTAHLATIRKVWGWSLFLGLFLNTSALVIRHLIVRVPPPKGTFPFAALLRELASEWATLSLACFYACSIFLLCQHPIWRERLKGFGAIGRTALTNYLLQSILMTWFFRLTGLYGKVGPATDLIPTFALYGAQLWFSQWWLRHYQFGPFEWIWRGLTYGKWPSIRKRSYPAPAAEPQLEASA